MMRLIFTLMLALSLLFVLLIALIRVYPYDTSELDESRAFLEELSSCAAPCLFGIMPGETTLDEAVRLLDALPWVGEITPYLCGENPTSRYCHDHIQWTMSAEYRPFARLNPFGDTAGIIELWRTTADSDFVAQTITVRTTLRFDDLRLLLEGVPTGSYLAVDRNYQPALVYYSLTYNIPGSAVQITIALDHLPCPATWIQYWNWQARIRLSADTNNTDYIPPYRVITVCP